MPEMQPESAALQWLRAWRSGQAGEVRAFLQSRQLDAIDLVAVLLVEQRERRQIGQTLTTETLLEWFPELHENTEAAVELIYGEFLLRKHLGERPDPEEYLRRFPALADWLGRQFALHSALQSSVRTVGDLDHTVDYVAPPEDPIPSQSESRRIGRYEIRSVLGKGGVGIAYQAWDPKLKRIVVVKTLRTGSGADDHERSRFRAEAEAIAQVRHPNIVQVFDVGDHNGEPYLAMEFCPGGSLAGKLSDPLPPREAAKLVQHIAQGVAAAHARHIIHRDLKPANVLLGDDDEPRVADFGLAKMLDTDSGDTHTGAIVGTPAYMAPEQAFGTSKLAGPTADVYSLGVILYECLTGKPPFKGATIAETLDQVRHREPLAVRQVQPRTPIDLETITHKCLQKDPARRYSTAAELADDLGRYLEGRPILARPVGPIARAWRWCRRNPVVASLMALVLVVLSAGLVSTTAMWRQAQHNFEESEKNFEKTVGAVNTYFKTVSENQLLFLPEMQPVRKELMTAAAPFFEDFVKQRKGDPRLRLQLALAHSSLAKIEADSGSQERAAAHLHEAETLFQTLRKTDRNNAVYRASHAESLIEKSYLLRTQGRLDESAQQLRAGAELYAGLAEQFPQQQHFLQRESRCWLELGELLLKKDPTEAVKLVGKGLTQVKKHVDALPGDPFAQYALAHSQAYAGQMLLSNGKVAATIPLVEAARISLEALASRPYAGQAQARISLAQALGILGDAYRQARRTDDAQKALLESERILEQFMLSAPTVRAYRHDRSVAQERLSELCQDQNDLPGAERWCKAAIAIREALYNEAPDYGNSAEELALSYRQMVPLAARRMDFQARLDWGQKAIDHLKRCPSTPKLKLLLARSAGGRARVLADLGRHSEALADYDLAIASSDGALRETMLAERAAVRAKTGN